MALTLAAVLSALLAALPTALISVGTFVGNVVAKIFLFPFEAFKSQPILILFYFWCMLFVDAFIIGFGTAWFFSIIGVDLSLSISGVTYLAIINAFFFFTTGWVLEAWHVLIMYTFGGVLGYSIWLAAKSALHSG